MVIELAEIVAQILSYEPGLKKVNPGIKKTQLITIERAKEYILKNFSKNISLNELAQYCYVSPFHFSRTFKQRMLSINTLSFYVRAGL
ncbi:MAG: AraC family transcriptional regulator [Bacteroidota bacterium]|nr:AraC family transcriptional regulator [Bacteroidota bacterium]